LEGHRKGLLGAESAVAVARLAGLWEAVVQRVEERIAVLVLVLVPSLVRILVDQFPLVVDDACDYASTNQPCS